MSTDSTLNNNFLHFCSLPISLPSTPPMFPSPPSSPAAMAWWFFLTAACIKLLLIPTYHSTDFEVHRHWLALTHSLPLHQWYTETNSEWTLDYPPLFAYFEFLLSFPASLVDPTIVHLQQGIRYSAFSVVIFQRVSVLVADLVLLLGVFIVVQRKRCDLDRKKLIFLLVIWSPALLIVDHVHFQYNGFLLGVLLVSLGFMVEGRDLAGGIVFAILICFKHLFAVAAPVYFVYILRHYCWGNGVWKGVRRFLVMGIGVVSIFVLAFGPFVYHGQMQQVLRRLFPFGRGLCHSYWAPNFWVFYIVLDKGLALVLRSLHFNIQASEASFTGGLVGDDPTFTILPQISPAISLGVVLLAMLPCIVQAWRFPRPKYIIRWVGYAYTCGFLFGWHVHEKASLHFVIPLSIVAVDSFEDARHYFLLVIVSCYSMFPLLFESKEYPIKVLLLVIHSLLMWSGFTSFLQRSSTSKATNNPKKPRPTRIKNRLVGWIESFYLIGLLVVEVWGQFLHRYMVGDRLPFLPLMLVSLYCAVAMMYSWIWQLGVIVKAGDDEPNKQMKAS